ncbi:hypothetical protein BKA70DRAFT_1156334 [Coprinopsis sp. MPI-PUGE-AT-0042]|nr:hypothetical protein BKA70DRAFT_1156334 [Coprinopsis sp. MPI-PUGE-AT-0042]
MTLKRAGSVTICEEDQPGALPPRKKQRLHIIIPSEDLMAASPPEAEHDLSFLSATSSGSADSLFDAVEQDTPPEEDIPIACRNPPVAISGLHFDPALLLPPELATQVFDFCQRTYFQTPGANQVMLFGRFPDPTSSSLTSSAGFPPILVSLLQTLENVLRPSLPKGTFGLLFPETPTQARQAIINLYHPGEGITPHVDLLGRYADGIIGVSFGSGCVMRFDEVVSPTRERNLEQTLARQDLFLPERSVLVLTEDARYKWTHGIDKRMEDRVLGTPTSKGNGASEGRSTAPCEEAVSIKRRTRISVTFRWMLSGADVVGAE